MKGRFPGSYLVRVRKPMSVITQAPVPVPRPAGAARDAEGAAPPSPVPSAGPDKLQVRPWADAVIDRVGYDPRSDYVERFWLGILGPTCTWFLRRLATRLELEPNGFSLDVADTARALGLGPGLGRQAPLGRAVSRCCQFGLAQRFGGGGLAVRRKLPPLARHQVARLPEVLQAEHAQWLERELVEQAAEREQQSRARQLALTLARAGEPPEAIRAQLERWRYPPALCDEAASWSVATAAPPAAGPQRPTSAARAHWPAARPAAATPPSGDAA
jgi:hypothetical protein